MRLIDSIAAPGSKLGGGMKTGTGDDRYVFDEGGEWVCVIDGATDVGPVRIFNENESDAAWYAETFASVLIDNPPTPDLSSQDYMASIVAHLRSASEKASRVPLKDAPLSCLPTAAATWVRRKGDVIEAATLGDTVAIVGGANGVTVMGDTDKQDLENQVAKDVMRKTEEDRLVWLQELRAIHNTPDGYWVFGVQAEATEHIIHQSTEWSDGARALIMSDGFYRLVTPYEKYTDAELLEAASETGLSRLLNELRALEQSPEDDQSIGRFKTSDDATALLVEF